MLGQWLGGILIHVLPKVQHTLNWLQQHRKHQELAKAWSGGTPHHFGKLSGHLLNKYKLTTPKNFSKRKKYIHTKTLKTVLFII